MSKEYQLKAGFLWRLAQFAEWPNNAFESADSSVICLLGENPFGEALEAAVRGGDRAWAKADRAIASECRAN